MHLKQIAILACTMSCLAFFTSCNKDSERKKTEGGLEYQIIEDSSGAPAAFGDVITLHITYRNFKDSLLGSTYAKGQPVVNKLEKPMFKGSIEEGLTMLSKGDSALFWIPLDSIYKGMPDSLFPKHLPKGTFICYGVKMINVEKPADTQKNQENTIAAYAEKTKLTFNKTESGLRYVITQEGSGISPQVGDTVAVHYTGRLATNDMVFDSSVPRGEPFKFPVGQKMVIAGWDEGLPLMKEGSKATFVIPSSLGYGEMGTPGGPIPPNAVLVFDIELLKVIKQSPTGQARK